GGGGGGGGSPRETINPSTPKLLFCLKKVEPEDYKDVPKDYDARKVIDTLSGTAYNGKFEEQRGETIFHGYPADDKSSVFRPQQDMIRSEFFKIAYYATCIADTLIKEDRLDTNSAGFEDVPSDYWARTIIDVLANVEILDKVRTIQGLRLAFNEPLRSITRAEAMKIFVEIYLTAQNEKLPAFSPAKNTFSDVNAGDWFAPYVQYGQKLGISQGFKNLDFAGTNFFDPNSFIKREEAAIWLYQFFITMEGKTIEEKRGVER
ncbi:S-layer homology domain-containing protein, partial [Candidatus Peregrinibacteria bacterium]|nr:S-layer homology domain-containing protein [Candidatus Peregrinibacteria bacterium]